MNADHVVRAISKTATRALAEVDQSPCTEAVLKHYREDANAVAAAILRTLSSFEVGTAHNVASEPFSRQRLSEIADKLDMDGSSAQLPIGTATQLS